MRTAFYLLLLAFLTVACEPKTTAPEDDTDSTSQVTDLEQPDPDRDFRISTDNFGAIEPGMTLVEVRDYYGEENIRETDIDVGEGMTEPGAELYPGTDNMASILLNPDGTVRRVTVSGKDSRWHTQGDIRIGASLQIVEAANDAPFELTGFEWDYGGTTTDWRGGSMPEGVQFRFSQTDSARLPDALIGDRTIQSDDAQMRAHTFAVREIFMQF